MSIRLILHEEAKPSQNSGGNTLAGGCLIHSQNVSWGQISWFAFTNSPQSESNSQEGEAGVRDTQPGYRLAPFFPKEVVCTFESPKMTFHLINK
jgi:hypothetical protein